MSFIHTVTSAVCDLGSSCRSEQLQSYGIPGVVVAATKCFTNNNAAPTEIIELVDCAHFETQAKAVKTRCVATLILNVFETCPAATLIPAICVDDSPEPKASYCLEPTPPPQITSPLISGVSSSSPPDPNGFAQVPTPQPTPATPGSSKSTETAASGASSGNGLGTGAAAGIGIGCALAGAAFAGLIFLWLFMRYKKRNHQQPVSAYAQHVGQYPEPTSHEKSQMVAVTHGISSVENYLPQPAADDEVTGDLSKLRDKIKDHVQGYYHLSVVSNQIVDQQRLQDAAAGIGISASKMKELLLNPHSRLLVIRLYLAWLILSRCDGQASARSSFLPAEISSFAPLISTVDKAKASEF
jgi:hypothetical protein